MEGMGGRLTWKIARKPVCYHVAHDRGDACHATDAEKRDHLDLFPERQLEPSDDIDWDAE